MHSVAAENDVLTDKSYYQGTYYSGYTVLAHIGMQHPSAKLTGCKREPCPKCFVACLTNFHNVNQLRITMHRGCKVHLYAWM